MVNPSSNRPSKDPSIHISIHPFFHPSVLPSIRSSIHPHKESMSCVFKPYHDKREFKEKEQKESGTENAYKTCFIFKRRRRTCMTGDCS
jgi:hypothetical protein